jgi:hypothetical protein
MSQYNQASFLPDPPPPGPRPAAVNICDLIELTAPGKIQYINIALRGFCDEASPTIQTSAVHWDEAAILLDGPAAQDATRVAALIELLRTSLGPRHLGRPVRCYRQGPRGGWTKVTDSNAETV